MSVLLRSGDNRYGIFGGFVLFLLALFFLPSCSHKPEGYLAGYTQLVDDTYYRLAAIGEGEHL